MDTNTNADHSKERLVTIPQACRHFGVTRALYRAISDGEIDVFELGGWPRVRLDEVRAWIERNKAAPRDRGTARKASRILRNGPQEVS